MDACIYNLEITITAISNLLQLLYATLLEVLTSGPAIILVVGTAFIACKMLQKKIRTSPLQCPVPEESADRGSLVLVPTRKSNTVDHNALLEVTITIQPMQQLLTDQGELVISTGHGSGLN